MSDNTNPENEKKIHQGENVSPEENTPYNDNITPHIIEKTAPAEQLAMAVDVSPEVVELENQLARMQGNLKSFSHKTDTAVSDVDNQNVPESQTSGSSDYTSSPVAKTTQSILDEIENLENAAKTDSATHIESQEKPLAVEKVWENQIAITNIQKPSIASKAAKAISTTGKKIINGLKPRNFFALGDDSTKPYKTDYDVLIIGAGHNGLTCAGYLARAGYNVKVVERRHIVGGAAVTEEFYPGFRNSMCSYTVSLLSPKVIKELELNKYGLTITDRATTGLVIGEGEDYLYMGDNLNSSLEQIAKTHPKDAENFVHFEEVLDAIADVLRDAALEAPPNIGGGLMDLFIAGKLARRIGRLSPYLQQHCIKLFTMSIADYLALWFEHPILVGELCYIAMVGNMQSVYAPGSAYVLLHHAFGEVNGTKGAWGHAIGGMGSITQAMAKSAQAHGADIEVSAPVKKVIVEDGMARGVLLEDGRTINAKVVVANTNPKLLFQKLVDRKDLDEDFANQIDRYRCVSGSFRMNVALKEVPKFKCLEGKGAAEDFLRGSISITPSKEYLEKAFNDAQRFGWSKNPVVELFVPSIYDDSLAPRGKHVASLFCQHFNPVLPDGKTWDDVKDEVVNLIIDTVTHYAPNFRDAIEGYVALSPLDLEREFGLIGGDIFHGCLHLDQIFAMRPVAEYADYRMPIKNLYLCGSGAHPGGGVSGFPGHNAAHAILKDLRNGEVNRY